MKSEKFESEILTLIKFFEIFCANEDCKSYEILTNYNGEDFIFSCKLDKPTYTLLLYAIEKLKSCPHEIKPRCRHCNANCYDKKEYKDMAKIMISSSIKQGVTRLKRGLFSTLTP